MDRCAGVVGVQIVCEDRTLDEVSKEANEDRRRPRGELWGPQTVRGC